MRGKEVFYPIGWDDNGLATERRVQNYYGISCDPHLTYDPDFVPPGPDRPKQAAPVPVSRRNFIELCRQLTEIDEHAYEQAWRQLGLSVDWSTSYRTINDRPAGRLAAGVPAGHRRGRRLPGAGAGAVGRDVRHRGRPGRDRGPADAGQLLAAGVRPARRRASWWSPPPGPNCCRPAWRWSRIRPTSGTPALFGQTAIDPAVRGERADPGRTTWPTRPRAPASRWSARSATPPT